MWSASALLLLAGQPRVQTPGEHSGPHGRAHHTLFYDEVQERVVLTGGAAVLDNRRSYEMYNDLWSFDGTAWTALPSSGDRLSGIRITSDSEKRVFAFGGNDGTTANGDLRVLENGQWRQVGTHPSIVTAESGFVFDAARNRFVAFGGSGSGRLVADVWEYDGTRWLKSPATPPPPRASHAMVYDARRKKTVVMGGMGARPAGGDTPILGDTWEYDGTAWTQARAPGPPARLGAGYAYDSRRGLVLVFGGSNHDGVRNDLWAWDGTSWKKLAENGPEPRVMGEIAYDRKRDRIVLFGGRRGVPDNADLSDTWEWDGASWRRIS